MQGEYSHVLVGNEDNKNVYIEYAEYLKILKIAKAGASDGSRGVLLGTKIGDKTYIFKVVEAVYSGSEGLELPVFSPDSWGRITAEIKEYYSSLEIVGQFSSHTPITPQRADYIMQEKYLLSDSRLLFVFDPIENEEKFYYYDKREFNFLNGFYFFDKFDKKIDLKVREAIICPVNREYELRIRFFDEIKDKIKRQNNIYAAIVLVVISLLIYTIVNCFELEKRIDDVIFTDGEETHWRSELNN